MRLIDADELMEHVWRDKLDSRELIAEMINNAHTITDRCKHCKYFEYDSVAKVDGIPLIVAHEICSKWGDGCKTSENGYCFLFEPKEEQE